MSFSFSDTPQPFFDHIEELRRRILICLAWLVGTSVVGFYFADPVLARLARPVGEFYFTAPTEAFFIKFKIALTLGVLLCIPVIIFNLWKFVEIALYPKEKNWIVYLVPASCILFYVGTSLAFFGVAPAAIRFLLGFQSPYLRPLISASDYLSFIFWMIIGFGTFFQLPLLVVVLTAVGLMKTKTLAAYRKHVVIGIVVLAAFLTPGPDVFSQMVLAAPSYVLFELSLLIAKRIEKKDAP